MDFDRNSMTVPVQSSDYTNKFLQKDSNLTTMEVVTQTNALSSISCLLAFFCPLSLNFSYRSILFGVLSLPT